MTKIEAQIIELACDKLFSDSLEQSCMVSMNFVGDLRIAIGSDKFITISNKDLFTAKYICFEGYIEDLTEAIRKIQETISINKKIIKMYMESHTVKIEEESED